MNMRNLEDMAVLKSAVDRAWKSIAHDVHRDMGGRVDRETAVEASIDYLDDASYQILHRMIKEWDYDAVIKYLKTNCVLN